MTAALIEVRDLGVAYRHDAGWLRVVDDVGFAVARGETFGLVGESGCGKSTIAYHLLGYQRPTSRVESGSILFDGADILKLPRPALDRLRGRRIALVPQNPTTALSPAMRVGKQVLEALALHRPEAANEAGIAELFRLVNLPDPDRIGRRYPHQLSGGQQQRVAIAMALAGQPDLLVLDEPTTGLDVTTQAQIIALLRDLRRRLGMAMVYVTHDLGVMAEIADRVGVMYAGQLVEVAPTAALFGRPRHPYTRGLIASIPRLGGGGRPAGRPLRGLLRREDLPSGCPFQPRCDHAEAACATTRQRLADAAPDHRVACQRWRQLEPFSPAADGAPSAVAPAAPEPLLDVAAVALGYEPLRFWRRHPPPPVVEDVSFAVAPGEVFALVGESGSGKSTIARAIGGLLAPRAGAISFAGLRLAGSVRARPVELRRRIQFVFQNPDASLNPRMTVGRIVARPLELFGGDGDIRERVAAALKDVRLDADYAGRYPDQLSGGERQRVAIARALVAEPTLLLCDEILSALDVSVQASILELLRRLRADHGLSMLFISHDLAVVRGLADRVGVLFGGRLMEIGDVADVFAPPFHPYTHALLMAVPGQHARDAASGRPAAPAPLPDHDGCVFAGRCPWQAGELCATRPPPWRTTPTGLRLRCHLPVDELAARAVWRAETADNLTQRNPV